LASPKRFKMIKKELIGLTIKIIDSKNKSNIGLEGKVIDETKSLLIIKSKTKMKKIIKKDVVIEVDGTKIDGKMLAARPEERLKG